MMKENEAVADRNYALRQSQAQRERRQRRLRLQSLSIEAKLHVAMLLQALKTKPLGLAYGRPVKPMLKTSKLLPS
jgi:hypothetical protein